MILIIIIVMNRRDAYLVEALVGLAATHPDALTVAEIARRRGLPVAFLGRLLAAAARRGLVVTSRGPSGGVRLAGRPASVTLADVLGAGATGAAGGVASRWLRDQLRETRDRLLGRLTLADLLERERTAAPDWTI